MRKLTALVSLAVAIAIGAAVVTKAQPQIKNYFKQSQANGDNELVIGGTLTIASGATVSGLVQGTGSLKIAAGTVTLDGTNPSSVATGLASITACALTNKRSTTPALDPTDFTIATAAVAGRLDIYAWKPTAAGDVTLIASTDNNDTIDYVCIGS